MTAARQRKPSVRAIVQEALARSGRDDPALLRACIAETRWQAPGVDPVSAARLCLSGAGLRLAEGTGPIAILPSGKDPVLVEAIREIDEERDRLERAIDDLSARRSTAVLAAIGRRLAEEGRTWGRIEGGSHPCDGSPSGLCCYDADEDPSLDDCLFCGGPDERK